MSSLQSRIAAIISYFTHFAFRYDGTEVHEAAACMAALTRGGADPVIYAPEADQAHVVDHQSGQEMPQTRGVIFLKK